MKTDWPPNTIATIRTMRRLGATWRIIGAAFDTDWLTVRNYALSNQATHQKTQNQKLRKLLRIAERELRA